MTLALPGFERPVHDLSKSQWFTPPPVIDAIREHFADWLKLAYRVTEPAAGDGRLVDLALEFDCLVDAIELDPRFARHMRDKYGPDVQRGPGVRVHRANALELPIAEPRYAELCLMNPPYEDGQDTDFLEWAVTHYRHTIAIVQARAEFTEDRHQRIWSKGHLARKLMFKTRPRFIGPDGNKGSAMGDFIVVGLDRQHQGPPEVYEWV